jgi:hypothetical protein
MMEKIVMHFSDEERQAMLELKGVGATVIRRLEQIGHSSLATLLVPPVFVWFVSAIHLRRLVNIIN